MKYEELKKGQVVHCPTEAEFERIIKMNNANKVSVDDFNSYREETTYDPCYTDGTGGIAYVAFDKGEGNEIIPSSEIVGSFELGDQVLADGLLVRYIGQTPCGKHIVQEDSHYDEGSEMLDGVLLYDEVESVSPTIEFNFKYFTDSEAAELRELIGETVEKYLSCK